jgi:hypothetical protein
VSSFNSGGAVAGPRPRPSLVAASLDLDGWSSWMYLSVSSGPTSLSIVDDLLGIYLHFWRMAAAASNLESKRVLHWPRSGPGQSAWAHPGPVRLLLPPGGPSWHFAFFPKYLRHFGTISSSDKIGGLPTWTLIFTFRSSKMFRCSTLVLASFGSDFVLHLNMNGTFLLLVWTWCVFVLFVCVFLQKHYTPKCTHKVELVILLACLVVG